MKSRTTMDTVKLLKANHLQELRGFVEPYIQGVFDEMLINQEGEEIIKHPTFHSAIWEASTKILPNLEVQVVVDANFNLHISSGSSGYVDFQINPVGMKLPIKCWIHTHPFGSAYFSGVDWRTIRIWGAKMESAYVLGGYSHYGVWSNKLPELLKIITYESIDEFSTRIQHMNKGFIGGEEE